MSQACRVHLDIVINGDGDGAAGTGLMVRVMELGDVRVLQGLCSRQALVGVDLQQALQQVQGLRAGMWEQRRQVCRLVVSHALPHRAGKGGPCGLNVCSAGPPCMQHTLTSCRLAERAILRAPVHKMSALYPASKQTSHGEPHHACSQGGDALRLCYLRILPSWAALHSVHRLA